MVVSKQDACNSKTSNGDVCGFARENRVNINTTKESVDLLRVETKELVASIKVTVEKTQDEIDKAMKKPGWMVTVLCSAVVALLILAFNLANRNKLFLLSNNNNSTHKESSIIGHPK